MNPRNEPRAPSISPAAVCVAAVLLLCGPLLFHRSLPRGSDVHAACHYAQAFAKAFGEGDLYPRWTDRSNRDLGAPMFVFYPPLAYYGVGAALWLTGSLVGAFKLYLTLLAILTFLAFYWLARDWIGPGLPAALAASLYLLLPYHVLDMYHRFAVAETSAFLFLPLVLLFARRSLRRREARDVALLASSYAGLIYTHVISAAMFSLFFGLWLLWEGRGRWPALARTVLACLLGLGLAAPALLPALIERSHVNIAWALEMPNGDFRINFLFRDDPLPGLGIQDPIKRPVLESAHAQLLLALVALGAALAWSARDEDGRRRDALVVGTGCLLAYLLQLEVSEPIWRLVPELPTIQFPWRFQTLMVLTAALLAGFALAAGRGQAGRRGRLVVVGALLLLAMLANVALAARDAYLKPFGFDEPQARQPEVVQWVQPALTPIQMTAYREFRQTRVDLPRAAFLQGSGQVEVVEWLSSRRVLRTDSSSGGTVRLRSFWFPGWRATLDGAPVPLDPSGDGTIKFHAPAGTHRVELTFGPTAIRGASRWIAWTSVALLVWVGLGGRRRFRRP